MCAGQYVRENNCYDKVKCHANHKYTVDRENVSKIILIFMLILILVLYYYLYLGSIAKAELLQMLRISAMSNAQFNHPTPPH